MSFLNSLILFTTITTICFGYTTTNCDNSSDKPCTIFMSPTESAFKNLFMQAVQALTAMSFDFTMGDFSNNPENAIKILNDIIRDEVTQDEIKKFVSSLSNVNYKNPTNIVIVADPEANSKISNKNSKITDGNGAKTNENVINTTLPPRTTKDRRKTGIGYQLINNNFRI